MTKRTEQQIVAEVAAAQDAYHAIVDTANRLDLKAASDAVKELRAELCAFLAHGANACPGFTVTGTIEEGQHAGKPKARKNGPGEPSCGVSPIGFLKTPEVIDNEGNLKSGAVYEVGCPVCLGRATGSSPERAVERWNAGKYVTTGENNEVR